MSQAVNSHEGGSEKSLLATFIHAGLSLGFFFRLEDGYIMWLRN
jgi:hypothetical protein